MSKVIFKDPELQAQFAEQGYVQIPLLESEDVAELTARFNHYFPEPAEGFFSSSYLNDFDLKREISDRIVEIIGQRFDRYFIDYQCFGSAFLSKTAGHRSEMPMHQDWSIVDESQFVAINIWTPLTDATHENGSLQVLPGSHNFAKVRRSPTLPNFWTGYENEMRPSLITLPVRAGEAIVLNQALVHASPPNATDVVRPAITTGLKSAGAGMEFNYQTAPGAVDIYQMEDDFLLRWENFHQAIFERPAFGKVVRQEAYAHPEMAEWEVLAYLRSMRSVPGAGQESVADATRVDLGSGTVPEAGGASTHKNLWQRLRGLFR